PDKNASWDVVQKAIHGGEHSAESHAASAAASRHGAAAHMKGVAKGRSWGVPIAIGVIALVLAVGGVIWVNALGEADALAMSVKSPNARRLESPSGQIGQTELNDGTKVKLGPESRMAIAEGFPEKARAVMINGTALVEPSAGGTKPFKVLVNDVWVTATGTRFVVANYV